MVTSGDRALAQWDGTPATVLAARLKTIKVDVVTNARVENVQASTGVYEKRNYTLSNGKTIENVDIFLPFFAVARTDCLPENLVDSAKRGRVSVNANSQSTVQKNVFAVGCGNRWMVGIDATIKKEAAAVAQNVQDVLDGKAPSISLSEECPATVDYVHIGLGEYTMMNMDQKCVVAAFLFVRVAHVAVGVAVTLEANVQGNVWGKCYFPWAICTQCMHQNLRQCWRCHVELFFKKKDGSQY